MKRFFEILLIAILTISCQDTKREDAVAAPQAEEVQDSIKLLQGDFVYVADAAVLRGENYIYGVKQDSMAIQLSKKIGTLKSNDFEMVPVKLRAKVIANPRNEGWNEIIEIREILEVAGSKARQDSIE